MCSSTIGSAGTGTATTINARALRGALQGLLDVLRRVESVGLGGLDSLDRPVVAEHLPARLGCRAHHRAADQAETEHANGRFRHGFKGGT